MHRSLMDGRATGSDQYVPRMLQQNFAPAYDRHAGEFHVWRRNGLQYAPRMDGMYASQLDGRSGDEQ